MIREYFESNKLKVVLAGLVFVISFIVYVDTVAPSVPFWDCGEFIATSYILGVPHPPGSPLYILLGRIATLIPTSESIAVRVNLMSPLVSALTNMMLFLIILKLLKSWGKPEKLEHKIAVFFGAFIGALTFAFTDSHWFNSEEAEVYAMSLFFTSLVVWLILVWEEKSDQPGHEKYLLFIAYLIGLAIGVHMLNLLAIFFVALIIYFRKKRISSVAYLVLDVIIGVAVVGLIFLFFHMFKMSFPLQALFTLGTFVGLYWYLYKNSRKERIREHAQNVLMGVAASGAFLVINVGVIQGLPKLANAFGLTAVVIAVLLLFAGAGISIAKRKTNVLSLILVSLVLIVVGYSTYATIFIRSAQDPAIDENDPETTKQAVAYLEREQYGKRSFLDVFDRRRWTPATKHKYKGAWDFFWKYQINHMYIRYFNWQFVGRYKASVDPFQFILPFPFLIGLYGLITHFQKDKHKALAVLSLFLFTGIMIVLYLNQEDPQPRERDYSYTGSFFAFSIWIGIGASTIIGQVSEIKKEKLKRAMVYVTTVLLLLVLPVNVLRANYHTHDRSGNFVAWDYSYNILQTCAPNAIIFTNGDNDTFPLWYLQEVEKIRKDVRIVNLSLLNTPWYIKQLRDMEPKVPIGNLTDSDIDRLTVIPWTKRKVRISPPPGSDLPPLEWELKPTILGRGLRVQDIMILQILESNKWQKPVYFAVTVSPENKLGLDSYMQMEGLAFRVHPKKVPRVNVQKMRHNLLKVYKYRNLNNPGVYYNDDIIRLLGNYRSGFFQLAIEYLDQGMKDSALAILDTMQARIPEEVIPIRNKDVYLQLGILYHECGRKEELERRLKVLRSRRNVSLNDQLKYASVYLYQLNDYDSAIEILEGLLISNPGNPDVTGLLVRSYEKAGRLKDAVAVLEQWLRLYPGDDSAKQMRDRLKKQLKAAEKTGSPGSDTIP